MKFSPNILFNGKFVTSCASSREIVLWGNNSKYMRSASIKISLTHSLTDINVFFKSGENNKISNNSLL